MSMSSVNREIADVLNSLESNFESKKMLQYYINKLAELYVQKRAISKNRKKKRYIITIKISK